MTLPNIVSPTVNSEWSIFQKTKPDATLSLAWLLDKLGEKEVKSFVYAHKNMRIEEVD